MSKIKSGSRTKVWYICCTTCLKGKHRHWWVNIDITQMHGQTLTSMKSVGKHQHWTSRVYMWYVYVYRYGYDHVYGYEYVYGHGYGYPGPSKAQTFSTKGELLTAVLTATFDVVRVEQICCRNRPLTIQPFGLLVINILHPQIFRVCVGDWSHQRFMHACFSEITVFIPTSCDLTHSWIAAVQKSSFAHFCGYLPIFAGHLRAFCGKTFGIFVQIREALEFPGHICLRKTLAFWSFNKFSKNQICFNVYSGLVYPIQRSLH